MENHIGKGESRANGNDDRNSEFIQKLWKKAGAV